MYTKNHLSRPSRLHTTSPAAQHFNPAHCYICATLFIFIYIYWNHNIAFLCPGGRKHKNELWILLLSCCRRSLSCSRENWNKSVWIKASSSGSFISFFSCFAVCDCTFPFFRFFKGFMALFWHSRWALDLAFYFWTCARLGSRRSELIWHSSHKSARVAFRNIKIYL